MLLDIQSVSKTFQLRSQGLLGLGVKQPFKALDDVSLAVNAGENFGLVGESGSGKTTLLRCIIQLERPSSGRIVFDGLDIAKLKGAELKALRTEIQMVFQDPYASLNPRLTVHDIVAEPLVIHRSAPVRQGAARPQTARAITDRVSELLERVGLGSHHLYRYPHEFSGGQRQRIGIARALALNPRLVLLDEPTSALDVSVQAQVLNLLQALQKQMGLTYFFISHDLAVIRYVCDRVALLRKGQVMECGTTEQIYKHPTHDYTRSLLASMPRDLVVATSHKMNPT